MFHGTWVAPQGRDDRLEGKRGIGERQHRSSPPVDGPAKAPRLVFASRRSGPCPALGRCIAYPPSA